MAQKITKMHLKRAVSAFLAVTTAITATPPITISAEDAEKYPYTLFAGSYSEGAITTTAGNFCVNGNVATNGTIVAAGNMNINGTKTENAGEEMIYIFNKIESKYFSGNNVDEYAEDYTLEEMNINIDIPTEVTGEATLTGNINISTALKALEDISLYGEVKNTNNSIIFSKYGNIIIDSQNVNLNGLVYAPFGDVVISAQNLNLNNVVIIADTISFDCPNLNANYSTNVGEFIENKSDILDIPKEEWGYLTDENEDGLPDLFEDIQNWKKLADADKDGLPNGIEEHIGSNINNIDTDNDGLNDYYEVFYSFTNPTLVDTDGNGISDAEEDFDDDGLVNLEEFVNKTHLFINDTDYDGVFDGDEVNVYNTNPLVKDTDGEGLIDGDEIAIGTNPNIQDTDYDGILDCNEKFNQVFTHSVVNKDSAVTKVSITMNCTGNISRTSTIESIMEKDYLCSEVAGLVGEPFEIKTTSEFESATITFTVDEAKLVNTTINDLLFLWYDEDSRVFKELPTTYDAENSTVSTVTTHFSKYMVVNSTDWFDAWKNAPVYDSEEYGEYSNYDTVLALDFSGSMSPSEKIKAKQAALAYVDTMQPGDKAAVVTYGSEATLVMSLTDDISELKKCLNGTLSSDGGTYFSSAVSVSAAALSESTAENKTIILMSDGQSYIENSVLESLDSSIVIHTIGLRTGTYDSELIKIASYTGGEYYKAATATELVDIYSNIGLKNKDVGKDTDGDGLADIFETAGMMLSNGRVIFTNPWKSDTDGDMLPDGDEISTIKNFKELISEETYYTPAYTYVFDIKSSPFSGDFDNSGLSDYDEVNKTNIYGKSYFVSSLNGNIIDIPASTVAFGYPNTNCGEAFITEESNQYFQYHASALIYANGEYWIKLYSQNEYDVWGYIECSKTNLSSEYLTKIIDNVNMSVTTCDQKWKEDNSVFYLQADYGSWIEEIEDYEYENSNVTFLGWYFPSYDLKGITSPIPHYSQVNAGPCAALCVMMCLYYKNFNDISPKEYLLNHFSTNYNGVLALNTNKVEQIGYEIDEDGNGKSETKYYYYKKEITTQDDKTEYVLDNSDVLKKYLDKGIPLIIGGATKSVGGYDHFAVMVGYVNDGSELSDYILIDPFDTNAFKTLDVFSSQYPSPAKQFNGGHLILRLK